MLLELVAWLVFNKLLSSFVQSLPRTMQKVFGFDHFANFGRDQKF
jgi:hypothetical protein